MNTLRTLFFLGLLLSLFYSCDTLPGPVQIDEERNLLRDLVVSPSRITHTPGTPPRDTTITIGISVVSPTGRLSQAPVYTVFSGNNQVKQASDTLRVFDASSSTYSGTYTLTVNNRITQTQTIFVFGQTNSGFLTNSLQRNISFEGLDNVPPVLVSAENPAEVIIPEAGQVTTFDCVAKVVHPFSQSQIQAVLVDLIDQNGAKLGNQSFQLRDDGQTAISGDAVAGDSLFTVRFQISSAQNPDNITLYYFARDLSGASSDTLVRTLSIRR